MRQPYCANPILMLISTPIVHFVPGVGDKDGILSLQPDFDDCFRQDLREATRDIMAEEVDSGRFPEVGLRRHPKPRCSTICKEEDSR